MGEEVQLLHFYGEQKVSERSLSKGSKRARLN